MERMQEVSDAILDDLLSRWHHWQVSSPHKGGFPARSAGMDDWRCSRQYDAENGALDGDLEACTMRGLDFQVSEMRDPHRTAIYLNARNLSTGVKVFRSLRLPQDFEACARIVVEARGILLIRLTAAGIV